MNLIWYHFLGSFPMKNIAILILFLSHGSLIGQEIKFEKQWKSFLQEFNYSHSVDYNSIEETDLQKVIETLNNLENNFQSLSEHNLINLYNFLVVYKIKLEYPIPSVKTVSDFFTSKLDLDFIDISLNELEKLIVEKTGGKAHLLLNCGAKSCPPLQFLDSNFSLSHYSFKAIDDKSIIRFDKETNEAAISNIFFWYEDDDWGEFSLDTIIHNLSKETINVSYQDYNWGLNDISSNEYLIFYPTKLYGKGGGEFKIFNNYYTQSENGIRSNFYSSFFQVLMGTNSGFNWGFDIKLRSVNQGKVGLFSALNFDNKKINFDNNINSYSRYGIAAIGPKVRYQPFKTKPNINFLHSVYFVPMKNTEGNDDYGYFDFQNVQVFNNAFIEKEITIRKRLFFDIGLHFENIRLGVHRNFNHTMQIQLPITFIYSYIPSRKFTVYGLANIAAKPIFRSAPNQNTQFIFSGYGQLGSGIKYYITENLELELLYTYFTDWTPGRLAHTFNLGVRVFRF